MIVNITELRARQVLRKYNSNHDRLGRFASGGGMGGGTMHAPDTGTGSGSGGAIKYKVMGPRTVALSPQGRELGYYKKMSDSVNGTRYNVYVTTPRTSGKKVGWVRSVKEAKAMIHDHVASTGYQGRPTRDERIARDEARRNRPGFTQAQISSAARRAGLPDDIIRLLEG